MKRATRSDKGTLRRNNTVTMDYDEFLKAYDEWRFHKITVSAMAKRLGVSTPTMSKKLEYILKNGGNVPPFWFSKDGRNLEDILIEQKIAELQAEQKEKQDSGNS